MYATKPLSLFKSHPEAAARPPPEGRNSGYLVVKGDEDGEDDGACCWGRCGETRVRDLPFPQDRVLTLSYTTSTGGKTSTTYTDMVVFVPVPDQPIASNRYYAVVATGKRKGLVRTCSGEEDMTLCCFSHRVNDVKPRPFDPADVYQQIEIVQRRRGQFTARAVATDGFPPYLYRQKYWRVYATKTKNHFDLGDAPGINAALRSRQLADVGLLDPIPTATLMPTAVGRWYCPFYLVKEEGVSPYEQMGHGAFYEVVLEQQWKQIHGHGGSRMYNTSVLVGGNVEARQEVSSGAERSGDGYVWFRAAARQGVGVCASVWDRMRWEEYMRGWIDEEVEEEAGKVAGRSVLVERFVVKRMGGGVVVAFDFVHLDKVRGKQSVTGIFS